MLRSRPSFIFVVLAVAALVSGGAAADAQTVSTYSGRAIGLQVTQVLPVPGTVLYADTGELASAGGSLSASLNSIAAGAVQTGPVACATLGSGGVASSTSRVVNLSAYAGTPLSLSASQVQSSSNANCGSAGGSFSITGLMVGGVAVTVTGAANQTVAVPGVGTLVINEQLHTGLSVITVNALHLRLATGEELIVCSSHSDMTCVTPSRPSTWGEIKRRFD